ncbi:MAG: hypothetical protein AB9834_04845 [Lentimicrobium sp.]
MSLKRIRVFARNAILIVLSMIVFAGAVGMSYKAHYCGGNLSGVAFYTELGLQKEVSCGCESACLSVDQPASDISASLSKDNCCSNVSFFSKLNIVSPVNHFSALALVQPIFIALSINIAPQLISKDEIIRVYDYQFRPPPIAGRQLVLFLSQQRIPFSIYNVRKV